MIDVSFQLKGSALTVVVLALVEYDPKTLAIELKEKIDQAPHFFCELAGAHQFRAVGKT